MDDQERAIRRLTSAVKACQKAGLVLVADVDARGIRVMPAEVYEANQQDLRYVDCDIVELDDACGGDSTRGGCAGTTMPTHS